MRLKLRVASATLRRWHLMLMERLAALPGVVVAVDSVSLGSGLPATADLLFDLEALLYGLPLNGPAARIAPSALVAFADPAPPADVTLDLCGDAPAEAGVVWQLTFDGRAGDEALLGILLEGRSPRAEITQGERVIAAARLGTDRNDIVLASFEDVLVRTVTLVLAAVQDPGRLRLPVLPDESSDVSPPRPPTTRDFAEAAVRQLGRRIGRELYHLCCNAPHWKVGWRRLDGPDLYDLRRHPDSAWHRLPDDGTRFYADPFPIAYRGRVTLFVEDYVHRLGKGIISAVAFGSQGPLGPPRPVLEEADHLSYPFVFEADGQIWMIPESSSAGRVDLFRATSFPGKWAKEATLLANVAASDATLVEHGGRWWLFATVLDGGGAFSDTLHLWHAPNFRGPWTPHPHNPVMIDIASARPAGRLVLRDGALLRSVQDCRRGYGAALGIARVTRLDLEGFEQKVENFIAPGPRWPGRRLHTLNSAGGLEFIDGSAFSSRWRRGSRKADFTSKYSPVES